MVKTDSKVVEFVVKAALGVAIFLAIPEKHPDDESRKVGSTFEREGDPPRREVDRQAEIDRLAPGGSWRHRNR